MRDKAGNELNEGDRVAFATLSYRQAHLRFGTVVEVDLGSSRGVRVKGEEGRPGGWKRWDAVVLVGGEPLDGQHDQ